MTALVVRFCWCNCSPKGSCYMGLLKYVESLWQEPTQKTSWFQVSPTVGLNFQKKEWMQKIEAPSTPKNKKERNLTILFSFPYVPRNLCQLFHVVCHYAAGWRTLNLRTPIAILPLAFIFPFSGNCNEGNHSAPKLRSEHGTQAWPIRVFSPSATVTLMQECVINKDQASRAPSCDSTRSY